MPNSPKIRTFLASAVLLCAIPALGQDAPKSILPPGFGDPEPAAPKPQKPEDQRGEAAANDLVPDVALRVPGSPSAVLPTPTVTDPVTGLPVNSVTPALMAASAQDLPPHLQRSTIQVGILGIDDGDMGASAFNRVNGRFLSAVMRRLDAPITSRWASILLRRALLSRAVTPSPLNGADWVAERSWLLLRMGEADSSRLLIQAVDVDKYTPKLFDVAMQASLATADPAGLCPLVEASLARKTKEPAWLMARAMCSGLAGESALASSQIDAARSKTRKGGIDALLPEKVIGAAGNTRRAVNVQWDDVSQLTAWRYGLATATAVEIPQRLFGTVGMHVTAWQASAPLLSATQRARSADVAAAMGILSSAALVDHYGAIGDETDSTEQTGKPPAMLRSAFVAPDNGARIDAMRQLWTDAALDQRGRYARLIVTARAAAMIAPSAAYADDIDMIVSAMLSAGLDTYADRWRSAAYAANTDAGMRARSLLAVGGTRPLVGFGAGDISSFASATGGAESIRAKFLFAGLAGLGRLSANEITSVAQDLNVPVGRGTPWTRALDRAVVLNAPGAVVLLCAVGLQASEWATIPPAHLYHIVTALRRSGFEAEARMIAAEAIMRS